MRKRYVLAAAVLLAGGAAGAEDGAGHDGVHADPRVGVLAQRCDFVGRGLGHAE